MWTSFHQWIYGAAPEVCLAYAYDNAKHQVALTVKQMQKVEGRVGISRCGRRGNTTASDASYPLVSPSRRKHFLPG